MDSNTIIGRDHEKNSKTSKSQRKIENSFDCEAHHRRRRYKQHQISN